MTQQEVLDLFRQSGALLEGHFILSSGLRSPIFLQKAKVFAWAVIRVLLGLAMIGVIMSLAPDQPSKSAVYSIALVVILAAIYGVYFWYQLRGVARARARAMIHAAAARCAAVCAHETAPPA